MLVNEIINKYFRDFALIRRELINFRYMGRDSINDKYWVIKKELFKEDFIVDKLKNNRRYFKHSKKTVFFGRMMIFSEFL